MRFYDHFDTTLATVLIGNNLAAILISTFAGYVFHDLLIAHIDDSAISIISSIVMACITFFFGDTLPKFVGKRAPDAVARITCYPLLFFFILFYPISLIFKGLTWLVKKIFRAKEGPSITGEDFAEEIQKKEESGELEENESDIIVNSLDFADTAVREVLTPKKRMEMIDTDGLTRDQLLEKLRKSSFSRIPIYYKDKNKIVGVLVVKNYLNAYFKDNRVSYLNYVQKPYYVNPRVKIDDLLDGMKDHHTQIAIVRKGEEVIGMVTIEDILEELVGNIKEKGNVMAEEGSK